VDNGFLNSIGIDKDNATRNRYIDIENKVSETKAWLDAHEGFYNSLSSSIQQELEKARKEMRNAKGFISPIELVLEGQTSSKPQDFELRDDYKPLYANYVQRAHNYLDIVKEKVVPSLPS
jgi:hypothetical protein